MAQYSAYTDIKIGASVVGLVAVVDLTFSGSAAGCPPPRTSFQQFAELAETANGNLRGLGKPVIIWTFADIPYEAVNALRDQLTNPNMSGAIFLASPDKDMMIQNYAAVMQWPLEPASYVQFGRWEELVLTFKRCVVQ